MSHSEPEHPGRPLSICFVSRALPVHRLGGLEHHLRDLSLALVARGHRVHILTTSGGATDPITADAHGSIAISEVPGTAPGDYSMLFLRETRAALLSLAAKETFDVIIPVEFAGLFLPRKIRGVPVVPLIHGTMTTETPLHPRFWQHLTLAEKLKAAWQFKARILLKRSFWRMVKRAPGIIVDSEFTRGELLQGAGGAETMVLKIHAVPLGIDPQRYPEVGLVEERAPDGPLRICLLGRLQKMKGVEIAIRAAEQLRLRGVAFQMTIGGSGDYQDEAAALISRLGLQAEVTLAGRIPPDDLAGFFADHDVFLFPDLTQPAFGLVAVEAMRYGLPVVAARSGAIPEVVTTETGWLYDPWSVNELTALLEEIEDRGSISVKSAAGRQQFNDHTADAMARRTERALRGILA